MRKFLLLLCLLMISTLSVRAISSLELTALAAYYADDTLLFATIRTDENFLQQLDTLLLNISSRITPEAQPPTTTLLLDTLAGDLANTTFEEGVRPWLGDTLAVGIQFDTEMLQTMGNSFPGYIAASVTDKAAAIATLDAVLEKNNFTDDYEISEEGDFTLYTADSSGDPSFAVSDDVLFFGTQPALFPLNPVESPLSEHADFEDMLTQLPESSYHALLYFNMTEIAALSADMAKLTGQSASGMVFSLNQQTGSQLWGFTILEETTLTIDAALKTNLDVLDNMGLTAYIPSAVDLDFAQHIPADATFVLQSSDFGAVTQAGLDNIRALSDFLAANGGFASLMGLPEEMLRREEIAALNLLTPGSFLAVFNVSFAGLTGLSLERDVLPVLDGDAAMVLRVLPAPRRFPLPTPFLPDAALLFQSSDEAGARMLLDALIAASEAYDTGYQVEAYGDEGAALVAPLLSQAARADLKMLDFMVAADGEVFALGTRPAVESAINAETPLTDTPEFQAAAVHFLPGSQSIGYISFAPLGTLIAEGIRENTFPRSALRNAGVLLRVAGLIESATLSSVVHEDGRALSRLTLTLWAEPPSFLLEN